MEQTSVPGTHLSILSSFETVNQPAYVTKKTQTQKDEQCPSTPPADTSSDVVTFHITREFHSNLVSNEVNEVFRHTLEIAKFEKENMIPVPFYREMALEAEPRRLFHVLPPLTGEYKNIGYTQFVINGPHREIGVEVFAPTLDNSGRPLHLPAHKKEFMYLNAEQVQTLHTHSMDSLQRVGQFPLVIFSHGNNTDPVLYRPLLEELASHGYEVLSLNHLYSSENAPQNFDSLALIQADNIQCIVEHIRKKGGRELIVLAGHSLGGAASVIAARRNPKEISACINLDGGLRGEKPAEALSTPLLQIISDHSQTPPKHIDEVIKASLEWQHLQDASEHAMTGVIADTCHNDFTASAMLYWLIGAKTLDGAIKAHVVASRAMVQFMNHWLKAPTTTPSNFHRQDSTTMD